MVAARVSLAVLLGVIAWLLAGPASAQVADRCLAVAQALARFVPARLAKRGVEQPFDRRRVLVALGGDRDHPILLRRSRSSAARSR